VPYLSVLALSDSFLTMWPTLASESGLELVVADEPSALERRTDAVGVISAGGAEPRLEEALRQAGNGGIEIAAVGALPDHRLAAAMVRAGAADYFALPGDQDALRSWVRERAERLRARVRLTEFAAAERAKYRFDGILGSSESLRKALALASRVIPHGGVTVMITGETGTGKELLARAIHYNGPRREAPFVEVNCAAIPSQLLESELFGHEKGAFTDASAAKPGLFEVANGGTIFLDEIGHLELPLQGKLLRALEERTIRRVGGTKQMPIDVRVIAATHVDLLGAVRRGQFREDLYYRLNVVPVELPALRERRDDVLLLARHFLTKFARDYGIPEPRLAASGERALLMRPWSGNVRELRNLMERALLLNATGTLGAEDFPAERTGDGAGAPRGIPFPAPLRDIVHAVATETLALCGGNKSEAARQLGITRPRLLRLLDDTNDESSTEATDDATA
jgi:DNA-binding NtrC family response regulator